MKTNSIYLVALLVMSAVATFGNDEPKKAGIAVVSAKGADIFKLIYRNETANRVKVNVYNDKSEVIFTESIYNTEGFILPLNFSKVGFGEYTVELIDASGKSFEKIVYQPETKLENIRVAKLTGAEGKFLLSVMSAKSDEVTVRIFDGNSNLLHTEVKSIDGNFAQVYSIKNLAGECSFEVSDKAGRVKTVKF